MLTEISLVNMPQANMNNNNNTTADLHSGSPMTAGQPVKEGRVHAVQNVNGRTSRVPVVLKVYSSCYDRFLVVARDSATCRECGFINLKNCSVRRGDQDYTSTFQVVPRDAEGRAMTFVCPSNRDYDLWMSLLSDCVTSPARGSQSSPTGSVFRVPSPRLGARKAVHSMPSLEEEE